MNLSSTNTLKTTSFLVLSVSFFALFSYIDNNNTVTVNWSATSASVSVFYASILFLSASALLIVAARATMVTWITVLVLLAVAGKRRRNLALEGRKITVDVAMYLIKVLVKDRGLVAVGCAVIASIVTMVGFTREV